MKRAFLGTFALCAASVFASDSFGGIGLVVQETSCGLGVDVVIPESPAAKSALKHGDLILAVDGKDLQELSFDERVSLFRDAENKPIELTYVSDGDTLTATLSRKVLTTEQVSSMDASVESAKGKKHVSTVALGEDNYVAVFLEATKSNGKKEKNPKTKLNGLRLVEIQGGVVSYEDLASGQTLMVDLNGRAIEGEGRK